MLIRFLHSYYEPVTLMLFPFYSHLLIMFITVEYTRHHVLDLFLIRLVVIVVGCSVVDAQPAETKQKISTAVSVELNKRHLCSVQLCLLCKYQEVDGVLWLDLAALRHGLSERGHHIFHQIVPQRKRVSFQQLVLLSLHLGQILLLKNNQIIQSTVAR